MLVFRFLAHHARTRYLEVVHSHVLADSKDSETFDLKQEIIILIAAHIYAVSSVISLLLGT